jgi:hypothetical protein
MRHKHLLLVSFCSLLFLSFGAFLPHYHHDARHPPTISNSSNSEAIESAADISKAVTNIVHRLVRIIYPLLLAVYLKSVNPKFGSLNATQLALAESFAKASVDIWDNVTLEDWGFRLHRVLEDNSPSDPLDPRAAVYDMICEGSSSKNITNDILASDSVCMIQTCGITRSACLTNSTRGNLEDREMSIDKDGGDDEGGGLPRRAITPVEHIRLPEIKPFPES